LEFEAPNGSSWSKDLKQTHDSARIVSEPNEKELSNMEIKDAKILLN